MKLSYKDNSIDAFGDAYEYLMGMYASSAGKSGNSQQGSGSGDSSNGSNNSRTSASDENQGIVRPEDCSGSQGVSGMPKTPGGFFSKEDGDKLAEKEGYDKEGGSSSQLERNWEEAAIKTSQKMAGKEAGRLKSTIEALYKTKTEKQTKTAKFLKIYADYLKKNFNMV